MSGFDVAVHGGEADGAYFEDHALTGTPPARIEVAVGGLSEVVLLDLPDDELEFGEHVIVYELDGIGHMCGGRGGCRSIARYRLPDSELDVLRRRRPRSADDVA